MFTIKYCHHESHILNIIPSKNEEPNQVAWDTNNAIKFYLILSITVYIPQFRPKLK